jgi:hypothetical protein
MSSEINNAFTCLHSRWPLIRTALEVEGITCFYQKSSSKMADHFLSTKEQEPEPPQKHQREYSQRDKDDDAELIFNGMKHVNEDADVLFVRVISKAKPVTSNILNRATPSSKRKKGYLSQDPAHELQPEIHMTPMAKAMGFTPISQSEWRSMHSPITNEPSSKPVYNKSSPQVPLNSSGLFSPRTRCLAGAALSLGGRDENPCDSEQLSTSDVNSINPNRSKFRYEVPSTHASSVIPSSISPVMDTGTPTEGVCFWSTHVQNRTFPWTYTNEKVPFALGNPEPVNSFEGLVKTDFSSLASQNNMTSDLKNGNLILLLSDFYYGQHRGDGQPEQKTYTTFKCISCFKVLKNVKFMNHMKHHLELEKQRSDSWENHTTCQHCHRQFPTPFQLQCHIDSVHTTQEPSAVCKTCELSFETDQLLLQHMKDNHKPGEMPYVCQVCNYRSSAFADVETHFRTFHENTNKLLCLFCLKIFKTTKSYMNHCWRHWSKKSVFPCSKCRLQFSSLKEETEHKTKSHQTFKKPEPLEGLPPETKVDVLTSVHSRRGMASIVLSNTDPCLSPVKTKKRKSMKTRFSGLPCSKGSD